METDRWGEESYESRRRRHQEGRLTGAEIKMQWVKDFGNLPGYLVEMPLASGLWPTESLTQSQIDSLGAAAEDVAEFRRAEALGEPFDPNWRQRIQTDESR